MTDTPDQIIDAAHQTVTDALDELVKGMRETIATLQARIEEVEAERDEFKAQVGAADEEYAEALQERDDALLHVKYWLLAVLVHGQRADDPRRLLRMVERAMGHG